MNEHFNIHEFEKDVLRAIYPPKPFYRKVGHRNGKVVVEVQGFFCMGTLRRKRRVPYKSIQLMTEDPGKARWHKSWLKWLRTLRRSTAWYDRHDKSFWLSLFGF